MFAESIKDTKNVFFAVNCPSAKEFAQGFCCHSKALLNLAIMGESAHNQTRGTFYLFTNEESPLAMEKEDGINCHF